MDIIDYLPNLTELNMFLRAHKDSSKIIEFDDGVILVVDINKLEQELNNKLEQELNNKLEQELN